MWGDDEMWSQTCGSGSIEDKGSSESKLPMIARPMGESLRMPPTSSYVRCMRYNAHQIHAMNQDCNEYCIA